MPFKSKKQRKFLFWKKPYLAKKWVRKYGAAPVPKAVKKAKKKK